MYACHVPMKLCLSKNYRQITATKDSRYIVDYRITLNFRRSKFSQIVIYEEFVEIFSQIRSTRTLHPMCQKFLLKYFRERSKIHKICKKTRENLALYGSLIPTRACMGTRLVVDMFYGYYREYTPLALKIVIKILHHHRNIHYLLATQLKKIGLCLVDDQYQT